MKSWMKQAVLFLTILAIGLIVFVVFSHVRPLLPGLLDPIGRIVLAVLLLGLSILVRRSKHMTLFGPTLYAFFAATVAMAVDTYLPTSRWLLNALDVPILSPAGLALDKLDSSVILIGLLILLTRLSGERLDTIYLKKGNLKEGLKTGILAFLIASVASYFIAGLLFGAQNLSIARILPWTPWIIIFIFGNAFNEELLFRGLFLSKINCVMNRTTANLVLILPFVLHHTGITYTNDALMFLVYLVPLAFVWGYLIQKTDSLLASVLFHAGTDVSVVLVIFSQLT